MAILKNTTVSGSLRATDTIAAQTAQFKILRAPHTSGGTDYGPGVSGNFLKSNGTSAYWVNLASGDIPTISITDKTSGTLPVNRGGTGVTTIANIQAGKDGDGNTISSTYLKLSGGTLTGDLGIIFGDTDKFLNFWYTGDKTAGASWRLGVLGSGSGDTNYFIIQSGTSTASATTWNNVIRIGQNTYDVAFGGNIYPLTNNTKTLGTSSNKWSNVYSTTFTGDLTGNVTGNASTATALTTDAGSSSQAIYFSGGKPVALDWRIGNGNVGEHNCNNITYNCCGYYTSNGPTVAANGVEVADAAVWSQAHSSNWVAQIASDYRTGQLWGRSRKNGTWQTWKKVIMADEGSSDLTNCNSVKFTGIWTCGSFTNKPTGVSDWGSLFNIRLYNTNNSFHRQLFFDCYDSDRIWTRSNNNGTWTSWRQIVTMENTNTAMGSVTQPVYIDANGRTTLCTAYSSASVNYATSAGAITSLTTNDAASSTNTWRRVWFSYSDNTTGRPAYSDNIVYQTSTGTLRASRYRVADNVELQYNSTDLCLDFVFI